MADCGAKERAARELIAESEKVRPTLVAVPNMNQNLRFASMIPPFHTSRRGTVSQEQKSVALGGDSIHTRRSGQSPSGAGRFWEAFTNCERATRIGRISTPRVELRQLVVFWETLAGALRPRFLSIRMKINRLQITPVRLNRDSAEF